MKTVCSRSTFLSTPAPITTIKQFLVGHKHRYLFCVTPKVGGNSWQYVLGTKINDMLQVMMINGTMFERYEPGHRKVVVDDYYKFMFVREPLERVISAYRKLCLRSKNCRAIILQKPSRSNKTGETVRHYIAVVVVKCSV